MAIVIFVLIIIGCLATSLAFTQWRPVTPQSGLPEMCSDIASNLPRYWEIAFPPPELCVTLRSSSLVLLKLAVVEDHFFP